jgi:hypothetical protein
MYLAVALALSAAVNELGTVARVGSADPTLIDGLWTQKILSMVSPSHGQMQAQKQLIIDLFLQSTPS